jgi:hypothetical protein
MFVLRLPSPVYLVHFGAHKLAESISRFMLGLSVRGQWRIFGGTGHRFPCEPGRRDRDELPRSRSRDRRTILEVVEKLDRRQLLSDIHSIPISISASNTPSFDNASLNTFNVLMCVNSQKIGLSHTKLDRRWCTTSESRRRPRTEVARAQYLFQSNSPQSPLKCGQHRQSRANRWLQNR